LPSNSNNSVSGTWNPTSVDFTNYNEQTFVFTPAVGSCTNATSYTYKITVKQKLDPTFDFPHYLQYPTTEFRELGRLILLIL